MTNDRRADSSRPTRSRPDGSSGLTGTHGREPSEDGRASTTRRRYVHLLGLVGAGAVAGCVGDDADDADDGDDPGLEADDGDDGQEPGVDDTDDTDDTEDADGVDDADDDGEEEADDDADDGGEDVTYLGDVVEFTDAFEMEGTVTADGQTAEMSGRFTGGDMYWELEMDGQEMEWYIVDDESYFVVEGQCFAGMMGDGFDEEEVDPSTYEDEVEETPEVAMTDTDEIDGEEVLVFELTEEEAAHHDEGLTYYVLADSGYLRRVEADSGTWDFTAWGEDVEDVEEPEMDCQEMAGPGGG